MQKCDVAAKKLNKVFNSLTAQHSFENSIAKSERRSKNKKPPSNKDSDDFVYGDDSMFEAESSALKSHTERRDYNHGRNNSESVKLTR